MSDGEIALSASQAIFCREVAHRFDEGNSLSGVFNVLARDGGFICQVRASDKIGPCRASVVTTEK
jgi:hypothetical protein